MLTESTADEILDNARRFGVTSYKFMLTRKGAEVAAKGGQTTDDGFLLDNFSNIAQLGSAGLAICHAENIEIISRVMPKIMATGRQDLAAWAEARPGYCETLDVIRASSIAKVAGCRIYFVHQHYPASIKAIPITITIILRKTLSMVTKMDISWSKIFPVSLLVFSTFFFA